MQRDTFTICSNGDKLITYFLYADKLTWSLWRHILIINSIRHTIHVAIIQLSLFKSSTFSALGQICISGHYFDRPYKTDTKNNTVINNCRLHNYRHASAYSISDTNRKVCSCYKNWKFLTNGKHDSNLRTVRRNFAVFDILKSRWTLFLQRVRQRKCVWNQLK